MLSHHGSRHERKILLITGCVQPGLKPNIDTAAKILFDRIGIECIESPATKCCGSLSYHLDAEDEAVLIIKQNIDNWWPLVEHNKIEAICMTASGCGVAIREYAQLLAHDIDYSQRAKKISQLYKDPAELIITSDPTTQETNADKISSYLKATDIKNSIAFHPPCTLQHGMQISNVIEPFLIRCGFKVTPFKDSHLCCGSAGTYNITQKKLSAQLLQNKLGNITSVNPDVIVTANIGCQLHLQSGTDHPVEHWLELLV